MKSGEGIVLLMAVAGMLILAGCVANQPVNTIQKSIINSVEIPTLPEQYVAAPAVRQENITNAVPVQAGPENPSSLSFGPETTEGFVNGSSSSGSGSGVTNPSAINTPANQVIPIATIHPTAQFDWNLKTEEAPLLRVQFRDTSNFHPSAWYWDFGDGSHSFIQNPSHVYNHEGQYTVRFTAGNCVGCYNSTRQIAVYDPGSPEPSLFAYPTEGRSPLVVRFNDTSDYPVLLLPTSWHWDFDDGSSAALQNPVHTFYEGRLYNVSFTVTNPRGTRQMYKIITVYIPVTRFTPNVTLGYAPAAVKFLDGSLNSASLPTNYLWDFDDGTGSMMQNPVHTFYNGRRYNVTFTVTSQAGTSSYTDTISAFNSDFSAVPHYGGNPLAVLFEDTGVGYPEPTAWYWDFGDGYSSDKRNTVHQYVAPGSYDVRFRVTGPAGVAWVSKTAVVTVA